MNTRITNPELKELIRDLRKKTYEVKKGIWKRIAEELEKPHRKRRIVNLQRINKYTKEDEVVVVPGKVLANGELNHKLTIAAFSFSKQAIKKIEKVGGRAISIRELMDQKPKGDGVKIIG